jgi:hypothetical protein
MDWTHRSVVSEAQSPLRAILAISAKISQRGKLAHLLRSTIMAEESEAGGIPDFICKISGKINFDFD